MTAIVKSFHTSALGELHGWWGDAIHPAHAGQDGKLISATAWHKEVHNCKTLNDAVERIGDICDGEPEKTHNEL